MEERILRQIDVALVISEKEAQLAFRGKDGKMDFRAFSIVGSLPLNWCKELYEYYWKKATTGPLKGGPEK